MSAGNRLSATVPEEHREKINKIGDDLDLEDADAERAVIRAGLVKLGYIDGEKDRARQFLALVRKVGVTLGGAGLAASTLGLFGWSVMQAIGFGLVLAGFAAIAGAEFAPKVDSQLRSVGGETA